AAGEPDATIADDDLAVRAEVGAPPAQPEQRHRVEPRDLRARIDQRAEEPAARTERPGRIDQQADLDAGLRASGQLVAQPLPDPVVLPDVVLEVDMVASGVDRVGDRAVLRLALGVELDAVRAQRRRFSRGDRNARELLAVPHRTLGLDL